MAGVYNSTLAPRAHMSHLPPTITRYVTQQGAGHSLLPPPRIWQRSPHTATSTSAEAQQGPPFPTRYPGAMDSNPKEDQRVVTNIVTGMGTSKGQDALVGLFAAHRGQLSLSIDPVWFAHELANIPGVGMDNGGRHSVGGRGQS